MALLSFIFGLLVGIVVALLGSIALVNLLLIRRAIRNEGGLQEIAGAVDEFQKTPILLNKEHLEQQQKDTEVQEEKPRPASYANQVDYFDTPRELQKDKRGLSPYTWHGMRSSPFANFPSPSDELPPNLYYDGWLEVQENIRGGWIRRWCVVKYGVLILFNRSTSTDCSALVNLANCSVRSLHAGPDEKEEELDIKDFMIEEEDSTSSQTAKEEYNNWKEYVSQLNPEEQEEMKKETADAPSPRSTPSKERKNYGPRVSNVKGGFAFQIYHPSNVTIWVTLPSFGKVSKEIKKGLFTDSSINLRAPTRALREAWIQNIENAISIPLRENPCLLPKLTKVSGPQEECHWFNVFISRYFRDMQQSSGFHHVIWRMIQTRFDRVKRKDFLGPMIVEDISLGDNMVYITNVSITENKENELLGEIGIGYNGGFKVKIVSEVYINWPRPKFTIIPCTVSVEVKSLKGVLRIYGPPVVGARFSASFLRLPDVEFRVSLQLGEKRRYHLTSLFPKVREFIESLMRKIMWKHTVVPNKFTFWLPMPKVKPLFRVEKVTSRRSRQRRQRERREEAEEKASRTDEGKASYARIIDVQSASDPASAFSGSDKSAWRRSVLPSRLTTSEIRLRPNTEVRGWLRKQGKTRKNWKRRWFELRDGFISYSVNNGGKVKGKIPISSLKNVYEALETKKMDIEWEFHLETARRIYYLLADTEEEMRFWISRLTSLLKYAGKAPLHPSTT